VNEHHTEIQNHGGSSIVPAEEQAGSSGEAQNNQNGGSSDQMANIGSSMVSVARPMTLITYQDGTN
jgi:hypothetical protein